LHTIMHTNIFDLHVCMFTYVYTYVYEHKSTRIHMFIYVHVYIYIFIYICVFVSHAHNTYTYVYIRTCIYICIFIYLCVFVSHAHTHTLSTVLCCWSVQKSLDTGTLFQKFWDSHISAVFRNSDIHTFRQFQHLFD